MKKNKIIALAQIFALCSAFSFAQSKSTNETQIRLEFALDITDYTKTVRTMTEFPLPKYIPASEYMEMSREEAFAKYKKIADSDSSNLLAQTVIGYCYKKGIGTKKDETASISYLKKAADKNFAPAQNTLATATADEKEAFSLYEKSASQNYVNGLYNLSACYAEGKGCEKSLKKAEECLLKVRDLHLDDEDIFLRIAAFHSEDLGESDEKSLPYYIEAAEKGNQNAMFPLWFNFFVEYNDLENEQNGENRAKWYRRDFEERAKDHAERDRIEQEKYPYLLKRAEKGELYAIKELVDYHKGYGTTHSNWLEAYKWQIKAADLNDVQSCFFVAEALVKGTYGEPDFDRAVYYYNKGRSLQEDKSYVYDKEIKEASFIALKANGFVNRYNKSKKEYFSAYTHFYGDDFSFVEPKKALAVCEKYADSDEEFALAAAYYRYLNESESSAREYLKSHGLEAAEKFLDYSNDENDPNSKTEQTKRAMWIRERNEEIEELEDALSENPDDGEAWYELAEIYDNSSKRKNKEKAFECYKKSAELTYKKAFYHLAWAYKSGKYFDSDLKKTCEAFERGGELGDDSCLTSLAEMLRDGTYFDQKKQVFVQDFDKAIELLKKAYSINPKSFMAKSELKNYNVSLTAADKEEDEAFYRLMGHKPKNVKPFDWDSWVFADYDFDDDEGKLPEYKEDEGYWKNTEVIECSFEEGEVTYFTRIDSLKAGKAYRLVFKEELNPEKFAVLYKYFSESDHASSLTLDLDLRKCDASWIPSHSICGKFRNLYLPENAIYLANDSLDVYAEKIVFGSQVKNFSDPVNSRTIGLLDFSLVTEEKFSPQLAFAITQLKVNYMRQIPIKAAFEIITIEDRHSLKVMKELRETLESNPDKKFIVDLTHSVYAVDPEYDEKVPFPKNFLAKQQNLYYLVLGDCEGIEFPENMCRDCKNLQSVIMWNYDPLSENAFTGVNKGCTVWKFGQPEVLLREIFY